MMCCPLVMIKRQRQREPTDHLTEHSIKWHRQVRYPHHSNDHSHLHNRRGRARLVRGTRVAGLSEFAIQTSVAVARRAAKPYDVTKYKACSFDLLLPSLRTWLAVRGPCPPSWAFDGVVLHIQRYPRDAEVQDVFGKSLKQIPDI
jgi:hypothetical protein